jgi:two-component system invasion response regulator UvrY
MKTALIADDQAIYRKGLVRILTEDFAPTIIDEAASGEEALRKARKNDYDLVLLDITMPGGEGEGLDVLKELKSSSPKLQVLVFSRRREEHHAVQALCAGAAGFLTKGSPADEWVDAIDVVIKGGRYYSKYLKEKLANAFVGSVDKPRHGTLSRRENQVMRMIASGKTIRGIARDMSLSAGAVSSYRDRLLRKMRMKSNAELTYYAIRNKLIDWSTPLCSDFSSSSSPFVFQV